MSVVKIENGAVVQAWHDVADVAAAVAKYGLDPATLVEADHPPGTLYDGSVFTSPPPSTPVIELESPILEALRDLAEDLGPVHAAKMTARFGPRRRP